MTSFNEITNLLYRYAELMDDGLLVEASDLFSNAKLKLDDQTWVFGSSEILAIWKSRIKIYPCGTPRTKHVITNPIIEIDDAAGTAICRSYYTVIQSAPNFPLQVIASGRYHDKFYLVGQKWMFEERDYSLLDFKGDINHHLITVSSESTL